MNKAHDTGGLRGARRRIPAAALTVGSLVGGAAAMLTLSTGTAGAASTANLGVSQTFSGSTSSGKTIDTIKVTNAGPDTATNVIVLLYLKSSINGYGVFGNAGVCVASPAPAGYT